MSIDPLKDNVCRFKKRCRGCTMVAPQDRPALCISIKCPDFTPCPGCGGNKTLHETDPGRMLCKTCLGNNPDMLKAIRLKEAGRISDDAHLVSTGNLDPDGPGTIKLRLSITPPGTPPPELNDNQKAYYNSRWTEYTGYYRSPASHFTVHMIILEEINLSFLNAKMMESFGEYSIELTRERAAASSLIQDWQKQLPEKEAQDIMDDEKSIAMIYDKYIEESSKRKRRGIARILSPDAICLAPLLTFHLDLPDILSRLGYTTVEIEGALQMLEKAPEGAGPEEMAEWFGFRPRQQYALNDEEEGLKPLSEVDEDHIELAEKAEPNE